MTDSRNGSSAATEHEPLLKKLRFTLQVMKRANADAKLGKPGLMSIWDQDVAGVEEAVKILSCGAESNRHSGAVGADKRAEQSNPGGGHEVTDRTDMKHMDVEKPLPDEPTPAAGGLMNAVAQPAVESILYKIRRRLNGPADAQLYDIRQIVDVALASQPSPAATVETTDARRMRELAEEIEDSYQCTIVRDLLLDEADRRVIVKALNAVGTKSASAPCSSQNTAESSPPVMSGAAGAGTQCSAGNGGANGLGWMETTADRGDGSSEFSGFEAETPFGTFYLIEIHGDAFTVEYDLTRIGEADTPDEAKRIGQRDFERRIAMSLVPVEPQSVLWCCHARGPDDVYAAPDYATALAWSDALNEVNWSKSSKLNIPDPASWDECMVRAAPAPWPYSPEAHAENLPKSVEGFSSPLTRPEQP